jgi:hypothetical protein
MTRVAKASSETRRVIPQARGRMTRANAASMLIVRPISSPSPWFSGCRQLAWKCLGLGRGNLPQERLRPGPRSCHWQKRRHRKRCRRRRDGPGTWLSFGIAQETGSITSAPFGEKGNFRDALPRVPARGPRRASLSLARRPPPWGTVVHCGCAGARKGRGCPIFSIFSSAKGNEANDTRTAPYRL